VHADSDQEDSRHERLCSDFERGRAFGFALGSDDTARVRVVGNFWQEHLERNIAIQLRVVRTVDLGHPSCSQERQDFVAAEPSAWSKGHSVAGM
jgi:hypothetical protein